jgi:putative phosphoribosyl transferase
LEVNSNVMNPSINKTTVVVPLNDIKLRGDLSVPQDAYAMVVFVHGSGSSRLSPRNQTVAKYLNEHRIATFLFDLLTYDEDTLYMKRFDIQLLASRLKEVTEWLAKHDECTDLPIGYFGASTGAAAALIAANATPKVSAIVSRGGRPDLAKDALPSVKAPTLLIVGGLDTDVIRLNWYAYKALLCEKELEIVPGASHLFEEKGTMEKVCVLATEWFEKHLQPIELLH